MIDLNDRHIDQARRRDTRPDARRELRVYVASAAEEMRAEREYLSLQVFPELRGICEDRGVELAGIDFRSRPSRGRMRDGKLVRLSLDELHLRRPFVLGLIGSVAGWMPSPSALARDQDLVERYPWLDRLTEEPRSLLEIEIERGVLARSEASDWSAFYLRTPSEDRSGISEEARRLASLKERIRRGGYRHRENLPDLDAFGEWVRGQLLTVIEREFPSLVRPGALDGEMRAQEAFAASRRRGYLPRPMLLRRLDRQVDEAAGPLIIRGEPGVGKSALLAWWAHDRRGREPASPMVVHHVAVSGASSGGRATPGSVVRSLIARIALALGDIGNTRGDDAELMRALPWWLAQGAAAGMILVIDGADQMVEGSRDLEWLPRHIPAGLRLIVATSRASGGDRGWEELHVEPLTLAERSALGAAGLLGGSVGRALQDGSTSELPANPLLLRARLEEYRLLGSHDRAAGANGAGARDQALAASSVPELFARKFDALEEEFGAGMVGTLLGALWCSRDGMSEDELRALLDCPRIDLADLLSSLGFHLLESDGRLRFFHDQMRRAVEARYASTADEARSHRLRLAAFLQERAGASRRAEELPALLDHLGDEERLLDCIADPEIALRMARLGRDYELIGLWLATAGVERMAELYEARLATLEGERSPAELAELARGIGDLLRRAGRLVEARRLLARALELPGADGGDGAEQAATRHGLAEVLRALGDLDGAERELRTVLALLDESAPDGKRLLADALDNLAGVLEEKGDLEAAESIYRRAITTIERVEGTGGRLVSTMMNNLASTLHRQGRFDEARALYEGAIERFRRLAGERHPETAAALNNLAALRFDLGDRVGAEESYRHALAIWEEALGAEHPAVGAALNNVASTLASRGEPEAIHLLHRAADIYRRAGGGTARAELAVVHFTLGRSHYYQGSLRESERAFLDALAIQDPLLGQGHIDTLTTLGWLAKVQRDLGGHAESRENFRIAIGGHERLLGGAHLRVGILLGDFGELLEAMHDADGAGEAFRRSLAILRAILPEEDRRVLRARGRVEALAAA